MPGVVHLEVAAVGFTPIQEGVEAHPVAVLGVL
jgi:hypothetical protein